MKKFTIEIYSIEWTTLAPIKCKIFNRGKRYPATIHLSNVDSNVLESNQATCGWIELDSDDFYFFINMPFVVMFDVAGMERIIAYGRILNKEWNAPTH